MPGIGYDTACAVFDLDIGQNLQKSAWEVSFQLQKILTRGHLYFGMLPVSEASTLLSSRERGKFPFGIGFVQEAGFETSKDKS